MAFQTLTCTIVVGGDQNHKHVRDWTRPVTYPEMLLLRHLHGEAHVLDVKDLAKVERSSREERDRLTQIYGKEVVDLLFPGVVGRLPEMESGFPKYDGPLPDGFLDDAPAPEPEPESKAKRGRKAEPPVLEPIEADVGPLPEA